MVMVSTSLLVKANLLGRVVYRLLEYIETMIMINSPHVQNLTIHFGVKLLHRFTLNEFRATLMTVW
jgi:hypothetical protein